MQFPPDIENSMPAPPDGDISLAQLIAYSIERERCVKQCYKAAAEEVTGAFLEVIEALVRFKEDHETRLVGLRDM